MNEKLQYATMLEIPVNTCNVTLKTGKRKKSSRKKVKNPEEVKEELMSKINSEQFNEENSAMDLQNQAEEYKDAINDVGMPEDVQDESQVYADSEEQTVSVKPIEQPKKKFRFSIIATQFVIIGVLVTTIFLTNVFNANSGINVFFRNVFGGEQTNVVDQRTHDEFAPVLAVGDMSDVSLSDGVMTFSGEGSVYAPCNGKITSVAQDGNGRYILEITHSENFKSVISGIDLAYAGLDDTVYSNIPVGYVSADGATMCFKGGDGTVISDYEIVDGSIVWAV